MDDSYYPEWRGGFYAMNAPETIPARQLPQGANQSLRAAGMGEGECFIGLGWSFKDGSGGGEIDASAFVLGDNGLVSSDGGFVFYNQPRDGLAGCLTLLGDECTAPAEELNGGGQGVDRQVFRLDFTKVPEGVGRIAFCLTLHDAEARGHTLAVLEEAHARVVDGETGLESMRFRMEGGFSTETAVQMGELYRRGEEWRFRAVGQGYAGGLPALAAGFGVRLESPPAAAVGTVEEPVEAEPHEETAAAAVKGMLAKVKRTTDAILKHQAAEVRSRLKPLLPQMKQALALGQNESGSRLILDKILQHVLGYTLEDIRTEQRIQGRSADYVLAPGGVDMAVIEAKRIGGPLKQRQIFQATSYAAYAGIKWAILTNVITWQLYKVTTTDRIEPHLVFSVDLSGGVSEEDAHRLMLLSKSGIVRKTPLERLWLKSRALSAESLISAILNEEVLLRIRKVVAQENGIQMELADIRAAVERDILRLE